MNTKTIISEFRKLDGSQQAEICFVMGKIAQVAKLYSAKTPIKYMAHQEWQGKNFYDEEVYFDKLSRWQLITYERIDSTYEYSIKTSLNKLEKVRDILWDIKEKDEEAADREYMKEEFQRKQSNPPSYSKNFTGKNHKTLEKMLKLLREKNEVENFFLAQCLKGKSKLTRKEYKDEKRKTYFNDQIKNCFRTIKVHMKISGDTIKYSQRTSKIVSL